MFSPKGGGESSGRSGVKRRRRESGGQFGERAYARAAEREAEKAAEKAGKKKSGGSGVSDAERQASRAQREKERLADRATREKERLADRATRERERLEDRAKRDAERAADRKSRLDLSTHQAKDPRIPAGFAQAMLDAASTVRPAGISSVTEADALGDKVVGTLPVAGEAKEAFLEFLAETMPPERFQINADGSGWYMDAVGRVFRIPPG